MKKLSLKEMTVEKIDKLLENKNIDPTLRANLEKKKELLANNQNVLK